MATTGMPPNMGQKTGISLHLTITVAPEKSKEFLSHFKPCIDHVTAEPDCTFFEVFQDPNEPGTFQIVENWSQDLEWFMAVQLKKEYYKPYLAATEPLWIKPRVFKFWERMPLSDGFVMSKPSNFK